MRRRERCWIAALSLLVPADRRADWREEWAAELAASGSPRGMALGALPDACHLATEAWTVDGIARDLRYAARSLGRKPLFSVVSIATLAVGIGATTAIYSVVDGILIDPLPFPDADRVVSYNLRAPGLDLELVPHSDATYLHFHELAEAVESFAVVAVDAVTSVQDGQPVRHTAFLVTEDFFDVVGVPPLLGRAFAAGEDRPGAEPVAILGEALWRQSYGADPDVIGRLVEMDGVQRRVVGVARDGLGLIDDDAGLYLPLPVDDVDPGVGSFGYLGVARLAEGRSVDDAAREFDALLERLWEAHPDEVSPATRAQAGFAANVVEGRELLVQGIREALWILLGTVAGVLLIAVANVANLFLVRAEGRRREQALRAALGAERIHLLRQYLSESLALAAVAGAAGVALASLGVRGLVALAPVDLPRIFQIEIDATVLAFAAAVSAAAGILFGLAPLAVRSVGSLDRALREGGRGAGGSRSASRLRGLLVVGQVAMAMVLLVASGLLVRSFGALRAAELGFDPRGALTFQISLPEVRYADREAVAEAHRGIAESLAAVAGVRAVATAVGLPLDQARNAGDVEVEDGAIPDSEVGPIVERRPVSPGWLGAMGIRLVGGRELAWADGVDDDDASSVVLVNETFARTFWPGEASPVGRRLRFGADGPWHEVVGVAGDVRFDAVDTEPGPMVYVPVALRPDLGRSFDVVVRTAGEPLALVAAAREAVGRVDPRLPLVRPRTLEGVVDDALSAASFTMVLLGIAAGVALLLGWVGIYGVVSYVVGGRTREIGVRMALGASAPSVLGDVVRRGMALAAVGLAGGVVASLALGRLLGALLYGVRAADPTTYVVTGALLAGAALLASWIPARRAARVDPVEALRTE